MMKSLMCTLCEYKATGATEDEAMDTMWAHLQDAHKKEATEMLEMSKEERDEAMQAARERIEDEEGEEGT